MALLRALIFLILEAVLVLHQGQGIVLTGQQQPQYQQIRTQYQFDQPQKLQLNFQQYLVETAPQATNQRGCSLPNTPESSYHAPARFVPFPAVDSNIKRQFVLLFHREGNPEHTHSNPHDNITLPGQPGQNGTASLIDPAIINEINELCGRDSLFYSFSPRHMRAIRLLAQVFSQQRTAADLLNLSKVELSRHEINPRVWYYALVSAFLSRPDLNGYVLPGPIDATPDLYVPWTIIQYAISQSTNRPLPTPERDSCTTAIGVISNDVRFPEPPGRPGQQSGGQRGQQGQQGQTSRPQIQRQNQQNQQFQRNQNQQNRNQFNSFGQQFGNFFSQFPVRNQISRQKRQLQQQFGGGYQFQNQFNQDQQGQQDQNVGNRGQQSGNRGQNDIPECILFNGTEGASGAENQLWYIREDVQVNEHHWFWHQYYPLQSQRHPDRRGEVFYFMHHHLIARYNAERLSNGLPPATAIDYRLNGNIGPGYFSDLNDRQSGLFWTPRLDNMPLSDISHENDPNFQLGMPIDNITMIYRTLLNHISQGVLFANQTTPPGQVPQQIPVDIRNAPGFSHLGNTFEASELSLNTALYNANGVHNFGHIFTGLATDPDYRCQRPTGVMADVSVTMRDPAFYRLHSFVDEFFDAYKFTLSPYQLEGGEWALRWPGVNLRSVDTVQRGQLNNLQTFWSIRRFPLEEGIDGSIHDGDINSLVCQQHLNHEPFQFRFIVDVDSCAQTQSNRGTIRLFMAPRFDLNGRRFTMAETRRLLFQLDAFPVELRRGRNVITRNSQDSSSTRPWSRTLQELLQDPDNGRRTDFCGCGWPQHLYIPKGRPEGMEFDLFAMITNWDEDSVEDSQEDLRIPEPCRSPYLYCGVPYRRYPDRRPMGYPFDRQVYSVVDRQGISRQVESLEEWVGNVGNAMGNVVTIRHLDRVLPAPPQQP